MSTEVDISLVGAASYFPEKIVDNNFFIEASEEKKHPMFRGAKLRHHISQHESASSLIVEATHKLADKLNLNCEKDFDIILSNVSLPDIPFTGSGAVVAKRLNSNAQHVYDIANGGCVSFIFMMNIARALFASSTAKTALICNVQSAAGRIFALPDNRKYPQSAIPGDGCGVAYFTASSESPVVSLVTQRTNEFAEDMKISTLDKRDWWQPGTSAFNVDFDNSKLAAIIRRGNRLVPEVLYRALEDARLPNSAIDYLITNQPNRVFLRNWREAVELTPAQHIETFDEHANLFGAALPVSLARAFTENIFNAGDKILLGGFSHAGDYSAAAIIDWQANT